MFQFRLKIRKIDESFTIWRAGYSLKSCETETYVDKIFFAKMIRSFREIRPDSAHDFWNVSQKWFNIVYFHICV